MNNIDVPSDAVGSTDEAQFSVNDSSDDNTAEISELEKDEIDAVSEYNDTAAQISEMENALAEASDNYRRLFAEYDNYRKRTAKEKTETYNHATMKCIENILPVIDSFERALESDCSDENYKNGMAMIFNQFKAILAKTYYGKNYRNLEPTNLEDMYTYVCKTVLKREAKDRPYSVASLYNYLYWKEHEIYRLTIAIECVRYGIAPDEAMKYVTLV